MIKHTLGLLVCLSLPALVSAQPAVRHLGAWNIANVSYTSSSPLSTVTDWNEGRPAQFGSLSLPGFDAWSFSSFGVQRTFLSLEPLTNGLFTGVTLAAFDDRMVVTHPLFTGLPGFGFVGYTVTGSYGFTGTPEFANIEITSRLITIDATPPAAITVDTFKRNSNGTGTGVDFLGVPQLALVSFVFGRPFDLELDIQANSAVSTSSSFRGGSFVDLSHTVVWGGLSGVFLADDSGDPIGPELTDWTLTSDSGTNYAEPFIVGAVPEPSTYGAIAALSLVVGAMLRRRRLSK